MNRIESMRSLVKQPVFWVLSLALGIRLYACLNTFIVNPDGVHYIHQARSIFYHQWNLLATCHVKFISPLPLLIAGSFFIFRDWVAAGRFVSLFFSFATLIPFYFLLRRFFDKAITAMTLLVYALIPFFISRSADVVRDPLFWFLICCGMLVFIRHLDENAGKRAQLDLLVSCCLFMLATWTRMEGVAFLLGSGIYLLIHKSDDRLKRAVFFSLPGLLAFLVLVIGALFIDRPLGTLLRIDKIQAELTQFGGHYDVLRDQLKALSKLHPDFIGEFLKDIRTIVWMVPFALIFNTFIEAFFYPYALFFFLGLIGLRDKWVSNSHILYFVTLFALSLVILYVHLLQTWLIYSRFLSILIFSSFIPMGYGIEKVLNLIKSRLKLKPLTAAISMAVFILAFGLGKSVRPIHEDKLPFRQAGEIIASQKAPEATARILGVSSTVYEWVFFYAHRDYPGALCAKAQVNNIPRSYENLVLKMRAEGIRYLLYEENQWPKKGVDFMAAPFEQDFKILGQWRHKDTGLLMLLELKNN